MHEIPANTETNLWSGIILIELGHRKFTNVISHFFTSFNCFFHKPLKQNKTVIETKRKITNSLEIIFENYLNNKYKQTFKM